MATEQAIQVRKEAIPMESGIFRPNSVESLWRLAEIFKATGMSPKGFETTEKICLALMLGAEIGLSPTQSLQSVMVVNGRPTIWGDAALGLVRSSGLLEDFSETFTDAGPKSVATCTVKRKGQATPIVRTFSWADAMRAGLSGKDLYKLYPQRMLAARARGFALRDGFADVLKGLSIREEVEDYQPTAEAVRVAANDAPEAKQLTEEIDSLIVEQPPSPTASGEMTAEEKAQIVEKEKAEARKGFTLSGEPVS